MTNKTTDSWESFTGANFLKTTHVAGANDPFIVTGVEIFEDDDISAKPRLTVEKGEEQYLFDLNVTNSNFCKNANVKSPKSLIGKKIYFNKVMVISPKTKKEVESLRIARIE